MATRFYLPSTGAADITPAFSTWTETTGADRLRCVTTKIASALTNKTQGHSATGANSTFLSRMYVSWPLAAQSLGASTIKGSIRVLESAANDNLDAMRLAVRIVSADGNTFRSPVVYGPANSTVGEFATTLRSKRLATGGATGAVTITAGDRVVIEIGTTNTASGTSLSDTINYGDDAAADLDDSEADTGADNPFVELAANLVFLASATLSKTEAADTSAATATVRIAGALAKTEAADTSAATAKISIVATSAPTEAADTLASTATIADVGEAEGTANITEAADTIASAAVLPIVATLAKTEGADTLLAPGKLLIVSVVTKTEASDSLAATSYGGTRSCITCGALTVGTLIIS
jgi:hypothetical protein